MADSLDALAEVLWFEGEYEESESLYKRALAMREKMLGLEHLRVSSTLHGLGGLYYSQGEFEKAESLLKRALTIREKTLGRDHQDVAATLGTLGMIHLGLGQYELTYKEGQRALEIHRSHLSHNLLFAEEGRRLNYAATMAASLDIAVSAHLQVVPRHQRGAELALTTLLHRKTLVLELGSRTIDTMRRSLPEESQYLLEELGRLRALYARIAMFDIRFSTEEQVRKLVSVQQEQEKIWRVLSKSDCAKRESSGSFSVSDIQRSLPGDGVLIEFVRYLKRFYYNGEIWLPIFSSERYAAYAAYLVFPDHVDWVDLGLAKDIENKVRTFRGQLLRERSISPALYEVLMAPVVERLGSVEQLFIAPDSALNLVPFAALYDGERYLVEQYDLRFLTTGRDLLLPRNIDDTSHDKVLVVANPTGVGKSLPGTEREAELVAQWFPHAQKLVHDEATETRMRAVNRPRLLHIGTHGFYERSNPERTFEAVAKRRESLRAFREELDPPIPVENPMMLSGLMLASPPPRERVSGENPDEVVLDDGRLTAYEVSGLDLRGTELVVLSACGTGLGKLHDRSSEGVMGLRRGFTLAGAQTVVTSLWDVSDNSASEVMARFYENLANGLGRADAMQQAQLDLLAMKELRHPIHWAPFVVTGEWRPLSATLLAMTAVRPSQPSPVSDEIRCCVTTESSGRSVPFGLMFIGLLGLTTLRRRRLSRKAE